MLQFTFVKKYLSNEGKTRSIKKLYRLDDADTRSQKYSKYYVFFINPLTFKNCDNDAEFDRPTTDLAPSAD